MPPFAQTNLGLLQQVRALGYGADDVDRVRRAYALAMQLFTAHFRPSGNTFLAHLVHTASLLAAAGASPVVAVAGLLHSAYTHGEFGDGRRGATAAKRTEVRAAVGSEAEALIQRYTETPWPQLICSAAACLATLPPQERSVLLMRLANELEDHLDHGTGDSPKLDIEPAIPWLGECARIASSLGSQSLASAFEEAAAHLAAVRAPVNATNAAPRAVAGAILYAGPQGSFLLPPRSHQLSWSVALRQRLPRSVLLRTAYQAACRALRWPRPR